MIFMTSYIFATKPHEFLGDLVTGEEDVYSKFFKLSEVWEKDKISLSSFLEEYCFLWRFPGFPY